MTTAASFLPWGALILAAIAVSLAILFGEFGDRIGRGFLLFWTFMAGIASAVAFGLFLAPEALL